MKTFLFSIVLSIAFFSSTVFSGPTEEILREQCLKPSVKLLDFGESSSSSAFVVRSQLVGHKYRNVALTAAHCVQGEDQYKVHIPSYDGNGTLMSYRTCLVWVYDFSQELDYAVILFESNDKMAVADLDLSGDIEWGQKIHHVGFGLGEEARLDEGRITAVQYKSGTSFKNRIRTNAFTLVGDSGGPLFNSKNKVIGICQGIRCHRGSDLHNVSFYGPTTYLKTWDVSVNNALEFVYNQKADMPVLAFAMLRLNQYDAGAKSNADIRWPLGPKTGD